ncbi:Mitochondrial import inner membrane translocase subunit tim8 [Fusarium falciforme]|nr:Mitochondrial import inner membrane translocase subunit tim8 [Fusarium falciforme]KAJ4207186.1 Mitochondrial import inner membrane translocase subunit tim8 [Fusarium falciforme]
MRSKLWVHPANPPRSIIGQLLQALRSSKILNRHSQKSSTRTQPLSCPPSTPSRTAHTQTAKMSAQQISIDNADLEKLSDNDRGELRQFLANEQQRSQIQAQTHSLTQMCWNKCVQGSIKNNKLDKGEETCLANCVERFLDVNYLTMKHLNGMRN